MREIDAEALVAALAHRPPPTLLDVREPHEVAEGVLPGARVCPRGDLEARAHEALPDPAAAVVVYCRRGPRARDAARTLERLGYRDVAVLGVGIEGWRAAGHALAPGPSAPGLSAAHRARYARHLALAEVGERGQAALLASRVLVVGAGGLGSPAALYLAAAGVGTLGLVDDDVVEASNLQRQILHATSRVGLPKTESARRTLDDLAPGVRVETFDRRVDASSAAELVAGWDVVLDGSDNAATRYALNAAALVAGVPLVHGSAARFDGQVTTFVGARAAARTGLPEGPCYACLYPDAADPALAPSCDVAGVLGVVPGVVGTLQATEALKLLLRRGAPLVGRLLVYDALAATLRELGVDRDPTCAACG